MEQVCVIDAIALIRLSRQRFHGWFILVHNAYCPPSSTKPSCTPNSNLYCCQKHQNALQIVRWHQKTSGRCQNPWILFWFLPWASFPNRLMRDVPRLSNVNSSSEKMLKVWRFWVFALKTLKIKALIFSVIFYLGSYWGFHWDEIKGDIAWLWWKWWWKLKWNKNK